jgi:hypothetical protein
MVYGIDIKHGMKSDARVWVQKLTDKALATKLLQVGKGDWSREEEQAFLAEAALRLLEGSEIKVLG